MAGDDNLTARWVHDALADARRRGRETFELTITHIRWHLEQGDVVCRCGSPWPAHCTACGEPDPMNWHDGGQHCRQGRAAYWRLGMTPEAVERLAP